MAEKASAAAAEGGVLRYVGVVDVAAGTASVTLKRCVAWQPAGCRAAVACFYRMRPAFRATTTPGSCAGLAPHLNIFRSQLPGGAPL